MSSRSRLNPCRHRLDALAVARQHQPRAFRFEGAIDPRGKPTAVRFNFRIAFWSPW
ncbi:hypothetical protein MTBUT4_30178 [Magnetospirillum sp. UT-4]|nr:hypothetical protein MTBUT4_30178 [Magnetospirillum sp. UT-4]